MGSSAERMKPEGIAEAEVERMCHHAEMDEPRRSHADEDVRADARRLVEPLPLHADDHPADDRGSEADHRLHEK